MAKLQKNDTPGVKEMLKNYRKSYQHIILHKLLFYCGDPSLAQPVDLRVQTRLLA